MNLPPEGRRPSVEAPPAPVAEAIKGLPNWAVGLFGGLGVLVVGLAVFSVALRSRDEGADAARARRAPRPPAAARTMPAAVVEPLAPPPSTLPEGTEAGKADPRGEAPRLPRARRVRGGLGSAEETGSDGNEVETTGEPPAPPVAAKAEPATPPPPAATAEADSDGPAPSLADAEKMQQQMESVLAALGPRIEECARAADVAGEVEVRVAVSQDGTVKASRLVGDLDGTAAAPCIQALVKKTRYQTFKGPSIKLSHRFSVE